MTEPNQAPYSYWWIFFPLSIFLGAVGGALLGKPGLGMGLGAALGTPLNLIFYYHHKKSRQG